jgi:phosphoglycerate dehydrogenase-like enzyme
VRRTGPRGPGDGGGPPGSGTAGSVVSVSLDPPLLLIGVDDKSSCLGAMTGSREFAVNVLGERHRDLAALFSRHGADRFDGTGIHAFGPWPGAQDGPPPLAGAGAAYRCTTVDSVPAGDHHRPPDRSRHPRTGRVTTRLVPQSIRHHGRTPAVNASPRTARQVVITGALFPELPLRALRAAGFEVTTAPGDLDEEGVIQALDGAWGYVLGGSERLSAGAWERLPDLAVACFLGTGYSSFMELPAGPSPTHFANTPHANAVAVAEMSLAHILDLVRAVTRTGTEVAAGRWSERPTPSLVGARLGIAGMGHVGRELARMAHAAFGTEILYWNRTPRPEPAALPYKAVGSLVDLFDSTDVVSLNFTHEPGVNDGVVAAEHLAALAPSGYLVNCSRAELVDPAALRSVLAEGTIAGASIDGYYTEPTPSPADDPHGLWPWGAASSHRAPYPCNRLPSAGVRCASPRGLGPRQPAARTADHEPAETGPALTSGSVGHGRPDPRPLPRPRRSKRRTVIHRGSAGSANSVPRFSGVLWRRRGPAVEGRSLSTLRVCLGPTAPPRQMQHEGRDVPRVVLAAMMPSFERQPGDAEGLRHTGALAQAVHLGEDRLGVGMTATEGIRRPRRPALPGELVTVVVAPTRPRARTGGILGGQQSAGLPERQPPVDLLLGEAGQLRAEGADVGPGGPHQDPVPLDALGGGQVHDRQPDLDDLADRARGRGVGPARGFDVHDVQEAPGVRAAHDENRKGADVCESPRFPCTGVREGVVEPGVPYESAVNFRGA